MIYRSYVPYLLIPAMLLSIPACRHKHDDHQHESVELTQANHSYTVYSDKLELFVEFKPLVVGSVSRFASHLTVTGDKFSALSDAKVTIRLLVNGSEQTNSTDSHDTPGIYRLALEPKISGKGKLEFDIAAKEFNDRIIIEDIIVYPDEAAAMAAPVSDAGAGSISYLKEQAWKTDFANAPVQKQNFSTVIKTGGQILSASGDETVITAVATGIVDFAGNRTISGSSVNMQTDLFIIRGGELTSANVEVKHQEAKVLFEKAKADHDRAKELVSDKIISEKDYLETKLKFENAKVNYDVLSKNYSEQGQIIRSPIQGFVKSVLVEQGQYVEEGTPLAIISKNKRLILQADLSQKYFSELPSINSASFKTTMNDDVYDTRSLNGKLLSYGRSTYTNSPFIPVSFEFENPGSIIPGTVAEVFLRSSAIKDALVVPVTALTEEQGFFFVYIQTNGESFEKREVKIAASDGINVRVISGINEGERIVTRGAYQIKLAAASGNMPEHGHEH